MWQGFAKQDTECINRYFTVIKSQILKLCSDTKIYWLNNNISATIMRNIFVFQNKESCSLNSGIHLGSKMKTDYIASENIANLGLSF